MGRARPTTLPVALDRGGSVRRANAGRGIPGNELPKGTVVTSAALLYLQRAAGNAATSGWLAGLSVQRTPVSDLEQKYQIKVEKGNEDWNEDNLKDLKNALGKLDKQEAERLNGYRFIRWTSIEDRQKIEPKFQPVGGECGFHQLDLARGDGLTISMYDRCFKDPEAKTQEEIAKMPLGQAKILHEIGHLLGDAELRRAFEEAERAHHAFEDADAEYQTALANKVSAKDQAKLEAKLNKLLEASGEARDKFDAAKGRAQNEVKELVSGKPALTDDSTTNADEALAEAFMMYKGDPKTLKKVNPALFTWFSNHGELHPIPKAKPPAKKSK